MIPHASTLCLEKTSVMVSSSKMQEVGEGEQSGKMKQQKGFSGIIHKGLILLRVMLKFDWWETERL